MTATVGRWARVAVVAAALLGVALLAVPTAHAHPFGPPPTALVSAADNEVVVEWGAAPDDALIIGMAIGILDDGSLDRYLEGPVQTAVPAAKEEELSASPKLREYLLDRIAVSQGQDRCEGTLAPIDNFATDGASITFACPEPVAAVDLRIAMLHDVHEAYRTFAITEGRGAPAQSVFTVETPEQRWDFSATPAHPRQQGSMSTAALAALGVGALGALGAVAWRRWS